MQEMLESWTQGDCGDGVVSSAMFKMLLPALHLGCYADQADGLFNDLTGGHSITPAQLGDKLKGHNQWTAVMPASTLPPSDVDFTYAAGYAQVQILVRLQPRAETSGSAAPEAGAPSPALSLASGSERAESSPLVQKP